MPVIDLGRVVGGGGGNVTVNGVSPDKNGNITLKPEDVGALSASGTAADSKKLGGKDASEYATKEDLENIDVPGGGETGSVAWDNVTDKPDYIVAQGTSGVWGYRKWNSGLAECWFNVTHKIDSFETVWGSLYESDEYFPTYAFPFTIYVLKSEAICPTMQGLGIITAQRNRANWQASPPLIFMRPMKTTSGGTAYVGYYMIGTWKE